MPRDLVSTTRLFHFLYFFLPIYLFSTSTASGQTHTGFAQPLPPSNLSSPDLSKDARLQRTITLDEAPISLSDLLHKCGARDTVLTCTRACQDQKLQVRLVKRPLAVLMNCLANLIPGEWEMDKDTGGYRFRMNKTSQLKRECWWEVYLRARDSAIQGQRDDTLQKLRTPLHLPKPPTGPAEGFTPEQQVEMQTHDITSRAFYNALPAGLQEQIAGNIDLTPYYRVSGLMTVSHEVGNATIQLGEMPAAIQSMIRQAAFRFTLDGDATVYFINIGQAIEPRVITPDGESTSAGSSIFIGNASQSSALWLNQQPLANEVQKRGNNAPIDWKLLASYQNSRIWSSSIPSSGALRQDHPQLPPRWSDVLRRLANVANMEYVSDYYSTLSKPLLGSALQQPLTSTLPEELNRCGIEQDMSWQKEGSGIYLFRNNRWYRNDMLEVPQKMLQKWLTTWLTSVPVAQPPHDLSNVQPEDIRLQMDWEANFVTALTPWQIANGLSYFGRETDILTYDPNKPSHKLLPFSGIATHCLEKYGTARFYASLDAQQREQIAHSRLPFFSLTPDQQKQALVLLPRLHAYTHTFPPLPVLLGFTCPQYTFTRGIGNDPGSRIRDIGAPQIFPLNLVLIPPSQAGVFGDR